MISFKIILLILLVHWLADFCIQTDEQAKGKSTDLTALFNHVATYSMVWLLAGYCIFDDWTKALLFSMITFLTHFLIDFNTSKVGKIYWDKGDHHNGFVIMGFDQILHYMQLFLTYIWLA